MRKIPCLFVRDFAVRWPDGGHKVRDEIHPDSAWVAAGEGRATRKWDGQAVLVKDREIFVRFDAKRGRMPPADFVPAQPEPDRVSGHWPGWIPAEGPAGRWVREAIVWARVNLFDGGPVPDGTYEAIGPKISTRHGTNPERQDAHILVPHGVDAVDAPRDFAGLMEFLRELQIEGLVWHHPDGRMAKIKRADFPYVPAYEVSGDWPGEQRKVAPRVDPDAPLIAPTGKAAAALAARVVEAAS